MKTLQIDENEARQLYKTASNEFKTTLEDTFGKDFFTGSIMDRIKTYEDACDELGINPLDEDKLTEFGLAKDDIAYRKLKVITRVLNEGWVADVCDTNVRRYYPWFCPNGSPSSFAFLGSNCGCSDAHAGSGSRLKFKTSELAEYAAKQFIDIWKDIQLG